MHKVHTSVNGLMRSAGARIFLACTQLFAALGAALTAITNKRRPKPAHDKTRRAFTRLILVFAQIMAATGGALLANPSTASAHNLQMDIQFVNMDPSFRPIFDARLTNNQPLIQAGDVITLVFGGLPALGTADGLGGFFDFYPVTGTQVLDARYVRPVPGGYAPVPVKKAPGFGTVIGTSDPTGQLKNFTLGPNTNGVTSSPSSAGNVNKGTIYGFYGDTGIFYSTDPRTAFGSWGSTSGNISNNRGETVNEVPVTSFDIEQLRALGMSSPVNCIFNSACRGDGPWGLGSPVAGPESGYQWAFRITNTLAPGVPAYAVETGPFRRIQYPGSQISNDTPGNTSGAVFDTSKDASTLGYALSPANPLPSTTSYTDSTSPKLVRFAVGRIVIDEPEYASITLKINDPSYIIQPNGCPMLNAMAFSGDAGINSGGKDIIWRYFNPTLAQWSPCLTVFKESVKTAYALNETFTYTLKAFNTGVFTLTNVTIQDTLPAGLTFVGAAPAATGTTVQTWNVGLIAPNKGWSAVITVLATTAGVKANTMALNSSQGVAKTQAIVGVAIPIMSEGKSVAPAAVAPGGTVTYTLTLTNSGTGNSATPVKVYETLPSGFTFTGLKQVTVNGANVTAFSSATAGTPVTISLPAAQAISPGSTAVIVFTAQVGASVTAGSYCNAFTTAYGATTSQTAGVACLTVASASIGDTIYRDWNGNGAQDAGDEGLPGVVITLSNGLTTTTNASGQYLFNGLLAGSYTVNVGVPSGYTVTGDPVGALDGQATYVLTSSQTLMTADFGLRPGGAGLIGDRVFVDVGNDGLFNTGTDTGIANVTVWLYEDTNGNGAIDTGDTQIVTATTSVTGFYSFSGLATGLNYIAKVDTTDPDIQTAFGANPYVASTPVLQAAPNLTTYLNADFGFFENRPSSIGDQLCFDVNNNRSVRSR